MTQEIRVLVLEDIEADALLAIHELSRAGIVFDWKRVETEDAFLQALQKYHPHIILADYSLPKYDGRSALRLTRTAKPDIPFVFVTGTLGEELAIDLLKEGATDHVLKNGLSRLGPAVQRALREHDDLQKRRDMEDAHRVALERYRQVIENASDVVFTTDREGNFTYTNAAGIRTSGYSVGELWGLNYLDLVVPEHRARLQRHLIRQVLSGTPSTSIEFPFRTKSGEIRWFSVNAALVHDNGTYSGFHLIARDVTKRKQVEDALKESEQRFRLMVEGIKGHAIYMLDPTGHIVSWNKGAERLRGYREDEALGRSLETLFPEEQVRRGIPGKLLKTADAEGQASIEQWFKRKDGSRFYGDMLITAVRDNQKTLRGFAVLTSDKTDQRQFEQTIRESEERFRMLFRANPAAIGLGKRDSGILIDVNDKYCEFFGYSRDEVIGKSVDELGLYAIATERNHLIREIERNGTVQNHETLFRTKSGGLRNALLSMGVIDVLGDSILVSMIVDVTDRRKALEALERSEEQYRESSEQLRALAARLQSVREDEQTRIAREIHDELGQALTGLKMDLAWVERKANEGATAVAVEKVRGMHQLIDETIRMVRRISSELRPGALDDLGLVAALEWQLGEFSERTSIQGEFRSEKDDYDLDRERATAVFRIFQESLTNIARHSGAKRFQVRLLLENRALVLEVQDNGRGITLAEIKQKTSLGLLGMRERALVFNGTVDITGSPGSGTTLTVRIPLAS